jgi:hypothetical protein
MRVAAVGVASTVAGVAATQPASISTPLVDLAALIVVGSSTHPDGSGNEDFFHGMFDAPPYNTGGNIEHVNFFTGPFGINQALQAHDGEQNAVLSSGWGAANASLLLMALQAQKDPALPQTLFILDNNVARPSGGFGTMYPWFALIGSTPSRRRPIPTPWGSSTGYEYDYNSNAPPTCSTRGRREFAGRLPVSAPEPERTDLPVNTDGSRSHVRQRQHMRHHRHRCRTECPDAQCGAVPADDRVAAYVTQRGNTTYVTYTSNGLPLANLIRARCAFGNVIADLTEPVLTRSSTRPTRTAIPSPQTRASIKSAGNTVLALLHARGTAAADTRRNPAGLTAPPARHRKRRRRPRSRRRGSAVGQEGPATSEEKPKPLTNVVRERQGRASVRG